MKDPVAGFLRHLSVEKNASPHTLRSYRSDLVEFTRALQGGIENADSRAIRGFLVSLHARGLAAVTVARKLAAVRSFYRFLVRRGVVERNPARETRGPRRAHKLVSFLPIVAMLGIMYFLLVRPQQREAKLHKKMVNALKKGDEVVTFGGLYGKILGFNGDRVALRVDEGVKVEIERGKIMRVVSGEGVVKGERAEKSSARAT